MTVDEAKKALEGTQRCELRDHAFGDAEVVWMRGKFEVASGYFSASALEVYVNNSDAYPGDGEHTTFLGAEAMQLRECGTLVAERNDSTGPDEYVEGKTTPGLTLGGVLDEITKPPKE